MIQVVAEAEKLESEKSDKPCKFIISPRFFVESLSQESGNGASALPDTIFSQNTLCKDTERSARAQTALAPVAIPYSKSISDAAQRARGSEYSASQ